MMHTRPNTSFDATHKRDVMQHVQIGLMRVHSSVGITGWVGVALLLLSFCAWRALPWLNDSSTASSIAEQQSAIRPMPTQPSAEPEGQRLLAGPTLRHSSDVPAVIKQFSKAVQSMGLVCPHADYKIMPITETDLGRLEVHANLKGSYPKVRGLIDALLSNEPGLAIKEFSMQRTNADIGDVDVKLRFVVYLADEWRDVTTRKRAAGAQP